MNCVGGKGNQLCVGGFAMTAKVSSILASVFLVQDELPAVYSVLSNCRKVGAGRLEKLSARCYFVR